MTHPIQVLVLIAGRWIGWTVVSTQAEARLEVERAQRQGFDVRVESAEGE